MNFEKWQALGNDYLIIERHALPFSLTPARVRKLCAPHFGIFADGVLLLSRSADPGYVAELRIYNPDGTEAELSGNGAREAILYLRRRGWTDRDSFAILTAAGPVRPQIAGADTCRVHMGRASLASKDYPGGAPDGRGELAVRGPFAVTGMQNPPAVAGAPGASECRSWLFQHVSIGNPQCAIHVSELATLQSLDLHLLGPAVEGHDEFPNRTNVSWYAQIASHPGDPAGSTRIRARIFERGVGETLSSGTGATGAAVAHVIESGGPLRGGEAARTVIVVLDGGELQVEVGEDLDIHLTGWARPVFAGSLSDELLKELHETE
jgi:diaminopimelate epimerase